MENTEHEPWYAAKTIFYSPGNDLYEERVVLHEAKNWDEAFAKSEKEAREYVKEQKSIGVDTEIVKMINVYHLYDSKISSGTEIFSSLRKTNLSKEDYIRTAYEDGMDWRSKEDWI